MKRGMTIARCLATLGAALLTGCAAQPAHLVTLPETARTDMQRLLDTAALDADNQEQFDKLSAIEAKQQALESALARLPRVSANGRAAESDDGVTAAQRLPAQLRFAPGDAAIDGDGQRAIEWVVAVLKATPVLRVDVVGHTDSIPVGRLGSDNWQLSAERARAAANLLVARGIDRRRVRIVARAETDPTAPNDNTAGRARNRRVEFFLVGRKDGDALAVASPPVADGVLRTPESARGDRVFVDGRPRCDSGDSVRLSCGPHVVQVGSAGRKQNVIVPCGGEIAVQR